jgi:methyltransferase
MHNSLLFILLLSFIVLQRIIELYIAKGNEKWMIQQGAVEFGQRHYKYMVLLHVLFIIFLSAETLIINRGISPAWPVFLSLFCLAQAVRIWVITSLGKFWNTKILVLPDTNVIRKGPYRYLKHPNYLVVALELISVPLLFNSFFTALLFTVLNILMLKIRIPLEEKALNTLTEYDETFQNCRRFIPKIVK